MVFLADRTQPGRLLAIETGTPAFLSVATEFLISLPIIIWLALVGFAHPAPIDVGGVFMTHLTGEISIFVFILPIIVILSSAILVSIPPGIRAAATPPTEAMRSH